jgi:hypothetical protein
VKGRGLFFCWRRGKQGFGIFGEILTTIGTVEALRKNDDMRARFRGLEDFAACMREIMCFVSPYGSC